MIRRLAATPSISDPAELVRRSRPSTDRRARRGGKDALGRAISASAPLQGPFYGGRVVPGLFHTQGGLRVDGNARVLRPDGTAIPDLSPAAARRPAFPGSAGALGYASGNGLLSAIALGRLPG